MRGTAAILLLGILAACSSAIDQQRAQPDRFTAWTDVPPEYRLGAGDEISVILPYNAELNYTGTVGPDGRFTMPLAGTFDVTGMTTNQLQAVLNQPLTKVTLTPNATVVVKKYAQGVYVGGEVKNPGLFTMQGRMDVLSATTLAGGMLDTARNDEIVIIRRGPDDRPMLRTVNVKQFIRSGDATQIVALQPLDIVYVPKSSISEVDLWIDQFINRVLPFNRSFNYTISKNGSLTP